MEKDHLYKESKFSDHFAIAKQIVMKQNGDFPSKPKSLTSVVTSLLKPSIKNTGIAPGPPIHTEIKPDQNITLSKPLSDSPVLLVPNVENGLKVDNPTYLHEKATEKFKPLANVPNIIQELVTPAKKGDKQAGFTLPNVGIMVAMIAAVILFYFLSKKKG